MKLEECEMLEDEKNEYVQTMKENNWKSICIFCFVEAIEFRAGNYATMSCPACNDWKGVVEL